ncbi:MAG: hypothetical protein ACTHMU_20870 [Thermomicrobiales bacterium]
MVAQAPTATWRRMAKRRSQPAVSNAWANVSNPNWLQLMQVGYLSKLRIYQTASGTYATAGPTSQDTLNQYCGPISWLTVKAQSVGTIFDVSGYMAAVISAVHNDYLYGNASLTAPPYANTAAPGTTAFADTYAFDIPIATHLDSVPYPVGLFQTALNDQVVNLGVTYTPIAIANISPGGGLYVGNQANLGTPAGTTYVQQDYFDPIAEPSAQPNLSLLHTWTEYSVPISADGDWTINLNPADILVRALILPITGAANALAPDASHVTRMRFVYGGNITPFDEDYKTIQSRMARQWSNITIPTGLLAYDFLADTRDERDFQNLSAMTMPRILVTGSGATYSGGAYLKVALEKLVPLQGK